MQQWAGHLKTQNKILRTILRHFQLVQKDLQHCSQKIESVQERVWARACEQESVWAWEHVCKRACEPERVCKRECVCSCMQEWGREHERVKTKAWSHSSLTSWWLIVNLSHLQQPSLNDWDWQKEKFSSRGWSLKWNTARLECYQDFSSQRH